VSTLLLRAEHREHLRSSGLSDETIAAARLMSVNPEQARRLGYASGLSGIAFPYPGTEIVVDGESHAYTRLRVDAERARAEGRRYENPLRACIEQGLTYYPYVPEAVAVLRKDPSQPVFVTEGEKKALKLGQEGFPAIGLPGVHMFADPESRKAPGDKPLHPDLARWAWRGRTVFVCFDSDRTEKEGVALACERLCTALTREGAVVRVAELPRLPGQAKTGADDFLVACGPVAFAEIIEGACPWRPFSWIVDLVPRTLPAEALEVALGPLKRHLVEATPAELRVAASRLTERFPDLDTDASLAALAPVAASTEPDAPMQVTTNGRQLRDVVDDAWEALHASAYGRRLFQYGGVLVFALDGSHEPGRALLHTVDQGLLAALLHRCATWVAVEDDGVRDSRLPPDVVRDMLALPDPALARLVGVVHLPVLRPDGTLVADGGYEPVSRLLQVVAPEVMAAVAHLPVVPSAKERAAALALLVKELLGDFPFARDSDRAHALAALVLPVVRHLVEGPTPLHLIEAPSEGTGKTLLADAISLVATGTAARPHTLPRTEEELRKKLTAALMSSPGVVLLDNLSQALDSESLAAVLTADVWSDRLLGQTKMVEVPNRALWLATANNPVVSRENARRSVRVRLDAAMERPWLREDFRHADLRAWVRAERGRLLGALITLVRGWMADGSPAGEVRLGSFEAWARVVGGILGSAGVQGFLADRHEETEVADPDEVEWGAFVVLWAERHGSATVDGGKLLTLAAEARMFGLDGTGPSMPRERSRFTRALAKRRDRLYAGHRLTIGRDPKRRQNVYALVGA
jgi:hypothetical protein